MLGVVSQTRVSGGNRSHDPHANSVAHYSLEYLGTLLNICKNRGIWRTLYINVENEKKNEILNLLQGLKKNLKKWNPNFSPFFVEC